MKNSISMVVLVFICMSFLCQAKDEFKDAIISFGKLPGSPDNYEGPLTSGDMRQIYRLMDLKVKFDKDFTNAKVFDVSEFLNKNCKHIIRRDVLFGDHFSKKTISFKMASGSNYGHVVDSIVAANPSCVAVINNDSILFLDSEDVAKKDAQLDRVVISFDVDGEGVNKMVTKGDLKQIDKLAAVKFEGDFSISEAAVADIVKFFSEKFGSEIKRKIEIGKQFAMKKTSFNIKGGDSLLDALKEMVKKNPKSRMVITADSIRLLDVKDED